MERMLSMFRRLSTEVDDVRFREAISSWINITQESPTDVILLHDSSGSVSAVDFALGKQAAAHLLDQFGTKTQVAVAQFSSECIVECRLTEDRELAKKRNLEMEPVGGDTKTELAFQVSKSIFSQGREKATKMLFLITDGHPDEDREAMLAAEVLKRMNVQIVGIGVGKVSLGKLSELCSKDSAFLLPSYRALVESVSTQKRSLFRLNSEVSYHFEGPKNPTAVGEIFLLKVEIRNVGEEEIAEGARVIMEGEGYFAKEVQVIPEVIYPGNVREIKFFLKCHQDAGIDRLPEKIEVKLLHPRTGQLYQSKNPYFPIHIYDFAGSLRKWYPPVSTYPIGNILVWGELGAGKSTLINSLLSVFSKSFEMVAISLKRENSVTSFLAPYRRDYTSFQLVDSVGLKFVQGEDETLSSILEGKYSFGKAASSEDGLPELDARQRKIHAALIVVPQGFRSQFYEKEHEVLNQHINGLVSHNINPILVVTRADENSKEAPDLSKEFEKLTGLPRDRIFCLDNSNPRAKELAREKILYSILSLALESAGAFMRGEASTISSSSSSSANQLESPSHPRTKAEEAAAGGAGAAAATGGRFPGRVQFLLVEDENTKELSEVYGDFSPEHDRLGELRRIVEEQHPGLKGFEFTNVITGNPIPLRHENVVALKYAARLEDQSLRILVNSKVPPPYHPN